jgi:class 3 adenylate cyclase/tetratricopeptide (TPR) repeat protein
MRNCDRCGRENADDASFCQNCGQSLRTGSAPEERKLVSVLFVDIVGSTASADRADPEDVRDRLRLFYETVREQVEHYDGALEKFIGDAVVAVFGAPLAHGDDAERAVRCGLASLGAIEALNARTPGVDLRARAAVNTGEAMVSVGTEHERGEALATGDVVNTAARLQGAAPPGGLVVGADTYRATRRVIAYEALAAVDAKGKREPVEAWLATGETDDERDAARSAFVGRDREIELLDTIWARVVDERRPHLLTILGPPGIGKSRLTTEFIGRTSRGGGRTIVGRSLPYEEQTGYRASAEHVKAVAGILETDTPDVARTKLTGAVADLLVADEAAEITRFLSLLLGLGLDDPSQDRLPLFFAVRRMIEGLAATGPVVLVFEDVHWADSSQLDLLEYLTTHVRDVPVVFLALGRPELLDSRPTWGGGLLAHTTVPLEPLSDADAAAVAGSALGADPASAATIRRLVEVAGGNPLFVEELAASVAEGAQTTDSLPATVRETIAARIDILPPVERAVLLDASVIGKTFWRGILRGIGAPDDLDVALAALEARDLIRHEPRSAVEGDSEFSFKHMLIHDVAYGTLPRAARRERHAAVAAHVEEIAGDHIRDVAWILAHHWKEAGEASRAVTYLVLAAERALEALAKDEAIQLYDEAVELIQDPALRTRVRLQRAFSLIELTDFRPGADEIDELLPELQGTDEIDALIARARASVWLEELDNGLGAARRAMDLAEARGDPERIAPAIGYLSGVLTLRGDIDEAIARGEEALQRWVPGTRGKDFAVTNEFLSDCYYWTGDYERAEGLARRAHELGDRSHSVEALLRGGGWQGVSLAAMGRTEEAIALLDELIETADRLGRPRFGAPSLNYSTLPFRDLFLLDEARRRNEAALEVVRREGEWGMPGMQAEIDLMFADLMEGEVGRALERWPRLWEEAINGATWRPWLGGTRLAYVRAEIARQSEGPQATVERAREAIERAVASRRRKYQADGRAILGTALVELGGGVDGLAELNEAVRLADELGSPTPRWRFRAALGSARYATGDDDGAAIAYAEAAEVIHAYAATLTDEHAAGFLDAEPVREALAGGAG